MPAGPETDAPAAERSTRGDEAFWDTYWRTLALPREVRKGQAAITDVITDVFDECLPPGAGRAALEIGGAPGAYAAYLHRALGYEVHVLDRSSIGCEKARENFRLLGIPGKVFSGDVFDAHTDPARFDVVYSLGLIEHFEDLTEGIRAHARFVEPGGTLLVGAPNFGGIYKPLFRRFASTALSTVRLETMDIMSWDAFEEALGLERVFRGYVGGFEPRQVSVMESRRFLDRALLGALHRLRYLTESRIGRGLRRWNGRTFSAYLLGVYRVRS